MLPFTIDQFLAVFAAYNLAIWPIHIIAYSLGLIVLTFLIRGRSSHADSVIAGILAAFWLWNGIAYHIGRFSTINPPAWLFGAAFIAQGFLFGWHALRRTPFCFAMGKAPGQIIGMLFIIYAMVVYELLSPALGHQWPNVPIFGVAPCPTTIFTFGVLLLARGRVPRTLLIVPLTWTVVGGSAAILLNVPEDFGLIVAGGVSAIILWRHSLSSHASKA